MRLREKALPGRNDIDQKSRPRQALALNHIWARDLAVGCANREMASAKSLFHRGPGKRGQREKEQWRRQAQRNALRISQTHRGLWFRADTLKGRVSGGHVNQALVRKDIVLTWGQTKQTFTLHRVHVNSAGTWQRSVSLPCKVCGEAEEEEGGDWGVYGQIDGDTCGGKPEELSPFFTKLKGHLVLSNKKSLNLCFQHSLGEWQSQPGCRCDPQSSLAREKQTVMADVRGNREHLFCSERKKKNCQKPGGTGNTQLCYEYSHGRKMGTEVKEKRGKNNTDLLFFSTPRLSQTSLRLLLVSTDRVTVTSLLSCLQRQTHTHIHTLSHTPPSVLRRPQAWCCWAAAADTGHWKFKSGQRRN